MQLTARSTLQYFVANLNKSFALRYLRMHEKALKLSFKNVDYSKYFTADLILLYKNGVSATIITKKFISFLGF